MATFRKICEEMSKNGYDFWDKKRQPDGDLDEKAMSVILRGLEIRPDRTDGQTFWDDFISVISNNSDAASHFLGVNSAVVSRWSAKIREGVDKAREDNSSKGTDMSKTGDR